MTLRQEIGWEVVCCHACRARLPKLKSLNYPIMHPLVLGLTCFDGRPLFQLHNPHLQRTLLSTLVNCKFLKLLEAA